MSTQVLQADRVGLTHAPRTGLASLGARARTAMQTLVLRTRRVTDPVADCIREAAAVRREALRLMAQNPGMAADLYAAADRHEREHGAAG